MEIFRLMHNLDDVTREVVYLRLSGDLKFFEIADIIGKTENWARVTYYRGKQANFISWGCDMVEKERIAFRRRKYLLSECYFTLFGIMGDIVRNKTPYYSERCVDFIRNSGYNITR